MYRHAIIACARWETPYIGEWIAYHAALGFERIYLCCNDDDPEELRAEVAAATRERPHLVSFTHMPGQGLQRDMYLAALKQARDEAEWVTFLDIDEFLVLRGCDDIARFMEPFAGSVDSVHFNWLYFGNSGFAERPPGSVLQQYTWRAASVNASSKHITRVARLDHDRLMLPSHPFWHGLGDPVWSDLKRVNVLGVDMAPILSSKPEGAAAYLGDPINNAAVLAKAVVNHYAFKSEADFLWRVARGTGGEFFGQSIWQEAHDSGNFRRILGEMSLVEDTYLHDLSRSGFCDGPGAAAAREPAPPLRVVRARHDAWTGDLVLGGNGRLRHAEHGSLASYRLENRTLYVEWDLWRPGVFVDRMGVFTSTTIPASPAAADGTSTPANPTAIDPAPSVADIQSSQPRSPVPMSVFSNERPDLGGNVRHGDMHTWSPKLWRYLVDVFAVRSVLDVGCGEGHAAAFFHSLGTIAHGIEGLALNVSRAVYPIAHHDLLERAYNMPVDLVWSCEVAEHILPEKVGNFLDTLANGRVVAMTHAVPGQGGHHHVNCQPAEYWVGKMQERGYDLSPDNQFFRDVSSKDEAWNYFQKSGLVFLRR